MTVAGRDRCQPSTYGGDEALLGGILDEVIEAVECPGALALHRRAVELGTRRAAATPRPPPSSPSSSPSWACRTSSC